jgi:hypothetical protein
MLQVFYISSGTMDGFWVMWGGKAWSAWLLAEHCA